MLGLIPLYPNVNSYINLRLKTVSSISPRRTMHSPSLPPDIFEEVIRHLRFEHLSLSACSLVCRTWVYPARRHLFYSLQVPEARSDLLQFLSTTPEVSQHIKELRLGHDNPLVKSRHRLNPSSLRRLLQCLPSLRSLSINAGFWEPSMTNDIPSEALPLNFPLLHSLSLTRVIIGGGTYGGIFGIRYSLLRLLALFPSLKQVHLLHTWVGDDSHLAQVSNEGLSSLDLALEKLVIHSQQSPGSLLNFFQVTRCFREIHQLDISCPEAGLVQPLHDFLIEAGSRITNLRLDLTCAVHWVMAESTWNI